MVPTMDSAIDYAIAIVVSFGAGVGVVWADARRRIRKAEQQHDDLWAKKNAQIDKYERLVDTLRRANHEGDKAEAALRNELKAERARNETLNLQLIDANTRATTASTAISPEAMRALGDVLVDVLHGRKSDDDEDLDDDDLGWAERLPQRGRAYG
jgi:hypothetical protein